MLEVPRRGDASGGGASTELPYRRILETANAGIWILDGEAATMFANAKMCEILGYPADEMSALALFDVLDDQGKAQAAKHLERRRQGISDQLECCFVRKDGSRVWVLLNASPFYDEAGDYLGSVSMMSEITDRKRIQDVLHQREALLAEAQRVAHLGSWEWDIAPDRISWSDELYRLFGLEPNGLEPTYEVYLSHVHPDDRPLVNEEVAAALQGQSGFDIEHRVLRPDGEVVWVHGRGEVARDVTGAPLRMRGTAQDVTASKQAEEALRSSEERTRAIIDTARECFVGMDEAGVITDWNRSAETTFGWSREEALGRSVAETIVPAHHREAHHAGLERVRATGVGPVLNNRIEITALNRDGHEFPVELSIWQAGGSGNGFNAFIQDITERKRIEQSLSQARDAAVESSRLKSEFLATMSHEIRTPMNGVIGLTGLLLGTGLDERQRQYAEGVRAAGEALLAIINDILDFSKIEAGKLDLEVVDFDVVQVVEEVAGLLAETAQRKGLELLTHCHPHLPEGLRGDPARLRQVLLNLASNAVKFTDRGEVVVRARLAPGSEQPSKSAKAKSEDTDETVVVRFEVVDTGIGIAEADRQRLFEPFSQADASTTRRFGGTGLGLAISRQLVAAMGGEIGVVSEPGGGSTFWFTVPLACSNNGAVARPRPVHHLLEGLRVLVVDDNETNRLILRDQLGAWDMLPETAESATSALERLRSAAAQGRPYELAVFDMCMPGMDGLALARAISDDPGLAGVRLVLLTSGPQVSAEEARQIGIVAMATKPVRLSELHDCLMGATAPGTVTKSDTAPRSTAVATGNRGHVLVVEDNTTNQMVALGILDELGFDADVVANGLEAVEAIARRDYAAVLMDCQMPEMDGYTATGEIRRLEGASRRTPVIAMTAAAVEGDRERCLQAGMDDYISKPVKSEDVDAALTRWVDEATSQGDVPPTISPDDAGGVGSPDGAVDQSRLKLLRGMGSDGSLLETMTEAFLAEGSEDLATIKDAAKDDDLPALGQSAHRLRGASANLGATGLAVLCKQLEEQAVAGRLERGPELLSGLETEFDRAVTALRGAVWPRP